MGFVRAHRVLVFFVLAYALSWAAVPFGGFFAPGALVSAVVVVTATEGVAGLRTLAGRVIRWRVGAVWYVLAIGMPLLVHAVTTAANVGLGAESPSTNQFSPWYGVLLAVGLNTVLGGPLSEEPSFRGFAQARLQDGRTPLEATAVMAVAVTGWHLPLFFLSSFGLRPIEALATVAVTFWYAWLFDHAKGSVLITLIAHATEGSVSLSGLWSAADEPRAAWLYTAVWCLVAVCLLVGDRTFWTRPASAEATDRDTPPAGVLPSEV
jgi:membrane protease YdiL (CAAX protease family)